MNNTGTPTSLEVKQAIEALKAALEKRYGNLDFSFVVRNDEGAIIALKNSHYPDEEVFPVTN